MANVNKPMNDADLGRCMALLGPAPILSTEDPKHFEEMFQLVVQCVKPLNLPEVMYLWHYVVACWNIKRYTRHATVAIERRHQLNREFLAQRAKAREKRLADLAMKKVQNAGQSPPDVADLVRLEQKITDLATETDDILEGTASERDHNKALEQTMAFQEQLNTLIISQTAIRNDALRQLELFRFGLSQLVEDTTTEIIEGQCTEINDLPQTTDAPLIPSFGEETANDFATRTESGSAQ